MGKKYLDTKKDSLEQSILGVWKTAVEEGSGRMDGRTTQYREHRKKLESARERRQNTKTEAYEIGSDEYRKYLERITPGEAIEEKSGDKEAYQKFFNSALKKFGVKSPAELKGDKKKEFFDYVDKNWTGDHEEAFEFAKKSKIDSMKEAIAKVWSFSEKVHKDEDKEVGGKKTLTGKKAAVVEIDPKPDIEKKKSGNPDH